MNDSEQVPEPTPVPDMGATYQIGSDEYPYTITRVSPSANTLWAKRCLVLTVDGARVYETPVNAREEKFTRRGDGRFRPTGRSCGCLTIGVRDFYLDPSF